MRKSVRLYDEPDSDSYLMNNQITTYSSEEQNEKETQLKNIEEIETEPREQWTNHLEFMLTIVGYAVGLGNVWRFPYLCYEYGGGAFLIPYWLSVFLIGIPMLALELGAGQRFRVGPLEAWKRIDPRLSGIGLATTIASALVGLYYNVILVWSTFYLVNSFQDPLPWEDDSNPDAAQQYFWDKIQRTDSILDLGNVTWQLALCHTFCWGILFVCLFKGIKGSGKVVYFTALFPYVVLVILFFRGVTLDGASDGIEYYLSPDWSQLLKPETWMAAVQQIFFSLSVCFGTHIAYGSFNPRTTNFIRDTWLVVLINCFTSFFAGFVVFSCLGFMAYQRGVNVDEVVESGTSLAFIAYPEALGQMPASPFFSTMFFLMMFCLGIDSEFGMLEGLITVLMEWSSRPKWVQKWQIVGVVCIVGWSFGWIFITGGGFYVVNLFDYFSTLSVLFMVAFLECIAICWVYGFEKFQNDVFLMTGYQLGNVWKILWKYFCPVIFIVLLMVSFFTYSGDYKDLFCKSYETEGDDPQTKYYDCPSLTLPVSIGVGLSLISLIWMPILAVLNYKEKRIEINQLTEDDLRK